MNVYDFDDTILWGDSTVKFFLYCLRRFPACRATLPATALAGVRYKLRRCTLTEFKSVLFRFIAALPDPQQTAERFWQAHSGDIKSWYLARRRPDDVVVSASPEFMLRPICRALGIAVIGTRVDLHTGKILGLNCKAGEKVLRFLAEYPQARVEEFFSDSLSDTPLAGLAQRAWLVKGERCAHWPKDARAEKTRKKHTHENRN